jgi:[ribosomal protein S5]-alanine N-acetyltransferase
MIIFETERLVARRFGPGDFEDMFSLNGDPSAMRYIRAPLNRAETEKFLEENIDYYASHPQYGRWALIEKKNKEFIGSFMLRPSALVPGEIEMGYALLKPHWGLGYATESVRQGLNYAFQNLNLPLVLAVTHPENLSSQKVLLKCGFNPHGEMVENGRRVNLFRIKNSRRLETERLILIPLDAAELECYLQANGKFEKSRSLKENGRTISPQVRKRVRAEILPKMKTAPADHFLFYTFWILIEKLSHTILGEMGFKGGPGENGQIEIGYGTLPQFRGKGYMREAVGGILTWARERTDIHSIIAEAEVNNLASIEILKKNNFRLLDRKKNMLWWKIELHPALL